jgi:uncharacterized protein
VRSLLRARNAFLAGALVLGGALLAGCGGDGDDESASTSSSAGGSSSSTDGSSSAGDTATTVSTTPGSAGDVVAASGNAPAAGGAEVDSPPGDPGRTPLDGFGEVAIGVRQPDGSVSGWCVLLAMTMAQRQQGLMRVEDLGGYSGMLFVFDQDSQASFYMANTPMPLSIAWFDAEGELVSTTDMDPCLDPNANCPTFPADGPYRFALEVPQGGLGDLGIGPGSRLSVGGSCADRSSS